MSERLPTEKTRPSQSRMTGPSVSLTRVQPRLPSTAMSGAPVGAENLRHQVIFVNHAPGAVAPLDPELIQVRDAVGQLP